MDNAENLEAPVAEGAPEVAFEELSVTKMLQSSLLFKGVEEAKLEAVVAQLKSVKFLAKEPIFLENEISDCVYFIKSGTVELVHNMPELHRTSRIAVLTPGNHFSEFSVLNQSFKTASAFAFSDCELMTLDGDAFINVLIKNPEISKRLAITLGDLNCRLANHEAAIEDYRSFGYQYHREIPNIFPVPMWKRFQALPIKYKSGVLHLALTQPFKKEVYQHIANTFPQIQIIACIIPESEFDEVAQKIQALYTGKVVTYDKKEPKETVVSKNSNEEFLASINLFKNVHPNVIQQILPYVKETTLQMNDLIFDPGSPSEFFFVVKAGEVVMTKPIAGIPAYVHLTDLQPGDSFGEMSLLTDLNHVHRAVASKATIVLSIHKSVFTQLLSLSTFSIEVAKKLALRLQKTNEKHGIQLYDQAKRFELGPLVDLLPASIIKQNKVVPLELKADELTVGIVNGENELIYSIIGRYLLNYTIKLVLISETQFKEFLARFEKKTAVTQTKGAGELTRSSQKELAGS